MKKSEPSLSGCGCLILILFIILILLWVLFSLIGGRSIW